MKALNFIEAVEAADSGLTTTPIAGTLMLDRKHEFELTRDTTGRIWVRFRVAINLKEPHTWNSWIPWEAPYRAIYFKAEWQHIVDEKPTTKYNSSLLKGMDMSIRFESDSDIPKTDEKPEADKVKAIVENYERLLRGNLSIFDSRWVFDPDFKEKPEADDNPSIFPIWEEYHRAHNQQVANYFEKKIAEAEGKQSPDSQIAELRERQDVLEQNLHTFKQNFDLQQELASSMVNVIESSQKYDARLKSLEKMTKAHRETLDDLVPIVEEDHRNLTMLSSAFWKHMGNEDAQPAKQPDTERLTSLMEELIAESDSVRGRVKWRKIINKIDHALGNEPTYPEAV